LPVDSALSMGTKSLAMVDLVDRRKKLPVKALR
jgi:hypothetical protein